MKILLLIIAALIIVGVYWYWTKDTNIYIAPDGEKTTVPADEWEAEINKDKG